jgi:hypothetical protein
MKKFKIWDYNPYATPEDDCSIIMTEEEILLEYWDYWCNQMHAIGKHDQISKEECINDWCAVHWAVEVKDEKSYTL